MADDTVKEDPTSRRFLQLRMDGGLAAVEVTSETACMVAGESNGVFVHKDVGTVVTGTKVSLLAPPEDIKIGAIFSINPFSYIPLAPALRIDPPVTGMASIANAVEEYIKILSGLSSLITAG